MAPRSRLLVTLVAAAVALGSGTSAQQRRLSVDAIFDPATRVRFAGSPPSGLQWTDETHYLQVRQTGTGREWLLVDAEHGTTTPLVDDARLTAALVALPVDRPVLRPEGTHVDLTFNRARTAAIFIVGGELYYYRLDGAAAVRLTRSPAPEEEASFSPDGRYVAFVREHDLYLVDVDRGRERRITTDGGRNVFNGQLDWVYQEEIFGRGTFRGYWWSPDSTRLAFLRLDEQAVPEWADLDDLPHHPSLVRTRYPRAGEANPTVRVGLASLSGKVDWADLRDYPAADLLLVEAAWAPDARRVFLQLQDREQHWLDLAAVDAHGGRPVRLLRESYGAWVEHHGDPVWLKDGSFLWLSDRTGFTHVEHRRPDGALIRAVTTGRWDVRVLHGVDEASGWIYYSGAEQQATGRDVYRVRLDGTGTTRLTRTAGMHRATFSPALSRYLDRWSAVTTPPQLRVYQADGTELRTIDANPAPALAEYGLVTPEFVQVPTRDGFVMEAMLIKPPGFDPARRYPVYQDTYGGPGMPQAVNQWTGPDHLFLQLLAQQGIVVWVCDNRSASGKGLESQWPVHGRLGELELADIEDGLTWLKRQGWVDPDRVAIGGFSFGGTVAAYALTHSTSFAAGIIGAPVTDWRLYDSVYTERYMGTPQRNPDAYDRTSVVRAADRLHGRALLIHGVTDDNVHLQNTTQFVAALQRAGKSFEMMLYPASRHGVTAPDQHRHYRQMTYDFLMRTLAPRSLAPSGR